MTAMNTTAQKVLADLAFACAAAFGIGMAVAAAAAGLVWLAA
jgi:hypothetical protein